jgi:hypothetical protein
MRDVAVVLSGLCALALVGFLGYQVGSPSGVDRDAVRAAAIEAGREEGVAQGANEGYAEGLQAARKRTYFPAYAKAYREAFVGEFEAAGLDPPQVIKVPRSQ